MWYSSIGMIDLQNLSTFNRKQTRESFCLGDIIIFILLILLSEEKVLFVRECHTACIQPCCILRKGEIIKPGVLMMFMAL